MKKKKGKVNVDSRITDWVSTLPKGGNSEFINELKDKCGLTLWQVKSRLRGNVQNIDESFLALLNNQVITYKILKNNLVWIDTTNTKLLRSIADLSGITYTGLKSGLTADKPSLKALRAVAMYLAKFATTDHSHLIIETN